MSAYYPWENCENGHDLTTANAFLYRSGGGRVCRQCATLELERKKKPRTKSDPHVPGSFQG